MARALDVDWMARALDVDWMVSLQPTMTDNTWNGDERLVPSLHGDLHEPASLVLSQVHKVATATLGERHTAGRRGGEGDREGRGGKGDREGDREGREGGQGGEGRGTGRGTGRGGEGTGRGGDKGYREGRGENDSVHCLQYNTACIFSTQTRC